MAIRTINYDVSLDGISPAAQQFGGVQGDHNVTELKFTLGTSLMNSIRAEAGENRIVYRFDGYDGSGNVCSTVPTQLSNDPCVYRLEEWITRFGGTVQVYLVITEIKDDETQVELYSFPALLRLKNRPDGEQADGESYESVATLAESTRAYAEKAQAVLSELLDAVPSVTTAEVEGGISVTVTDKNGTTVAMVRDGVDGDKGDKGEKGDTGAAGKNGTNGKDGYTPVKGVDYFDGVNGKDGRDGVDGKTPVKGTDYWTDADKADIVADVLEAFNDVFDAIPKAVHIAVGKEFKMYYKNVMSRYTDRLWLGYTSGITVKRYAEYLSITATEAMTKSINWKIYDESFNVLNSGTMTVIATADASKTSKVLVIGDSTVTQSNAISQKLLDCYSESSGTLTLLGTRGTSPALHEGRAGWTSTQYCMVASNGSVTNPFYNSGFDFSYYMTQQGYSGVDIVVIQLGINDIFSMTHENFDASVTLNNLDTMINSILAYDSNIKVIVNLISVPNGNGTSFTNTYNTTQIDFVYLVNTIRLSAALIEHFGGNTSVTISPNNCVLDAKTDINDGVHPNSTGYAKLGQAIYETINGIYEESESGSEEEGTTNELWDVGSRTAKVNTYKAAGDAYTFSNDYYYYPAAYTGPLTNDSNGAYTVSNVSVGDNSLSFQCKKTAFGIFVPFVGLDSTKTYRFTVNPTVAGFRVYLVNYDSTGVYKNNAIIVDKTTGLTTYEFTPIEGYQQGFCFACLSETVNTLGIFNDISLVEATE